MFQHIKVNIELRGVKGHKKYQPPGIKKISHGDIMYSRGKIVNIIVVTLYGDSIY